MSAYLKVENIGVAPEEGFTVFGVSLSDTSNNSGVIGQFGSGNKHGVAVLLRNELSPVVFAGSLKLEFGTRPQTVADSQATKEFNRVVVKYGGTDPITGASRSSTEDLGFVLDYGRQDWGEVALALREFVSNAIDRSIREVGDWSTVKIEIVNEAQVRAKSGFTRVFVPLNANVLEFYNNLGKWFLHFSEPESLKMAPENLVSAAASYGVQTSASVLSVDELSGREITEASPDAQASVDLVWEILEEIGLTNEKEKPPVRCFTSILDGGVMLNGYYRDGEVFINRDLGGSGSVVAGRSAISDRLVKVALEEVAHYATNGATDNSRDFQDFVLEVAVKLARKCEGVEA